MYPQKCSYNEFQVMELFFMTRPSVNIHPKIGFVYFD